MENGGLKSSTSSLPRFSYWQLWEYCYPSTTTWCHWLSTCWYTDRVIDSHTNSAGETARTERKLHGPKRIHRCYKMASRVAWMEIHHNRHRYCWRSNLSDNVTLLQPTEDSSNHLQRQMTAFQKPFGGRFFFLRYSGSVIVRYASSTISGHPSNCSGLWNTPYCKVVSSSHFKSK